MNCLLILSLAVLGASAAPSCISSCGSCAPALQGRTICAQTPVIENPTTVFPGCIPPASVSQSCHCMKTLVRPQIRNEIITVPTVDRIVRYVPSPVVEAVSVNCGGNTRNFQVPTCGLSGISGVSGLSSLSGVSGISGGIVEGVVGGYGINSGLVGNVGCGEVVSTGLLNSGIVGNVGLINSGIVGTGCGRIVSTCA